ncbi:hypothetical protein [Jannaschia seosinensis]|nr:hypothetical protein [Jannaschia seosinensis]
MRRPINVSGGASLDGRGRNAIRRFLFPALRSKPMARIRLIGH